MKSAKIIEINQLSSNTRKQNSKTQRFSSVGKSSIIWSLYKDIYLWEVAYER